MRERRPDTSSKEPEHKPLPRKQRAREDVLRDKQILIAVALPLVLLVVTVAIYRWLYFEPRVSGPCQGICDITADMLERSRAPCRPVDPEKLFFLHIPKTGGTTMKEGIMLSCQRG